VCIKRPRHLILLDRNDPTNVRGELWFDVWVLGFSYDGSRRVDFVASIENIVVDPVNGENAQLWTVGQQFYHSIFGGSGTVTPPTTTTRNQPLGSWDTTPYWTLTYTSPDSTTDTTAQIVSSLVSMDLLAGSPTANPYVEVNVANANVRYDSAGAIAGKAKGTGSSTAPSRTPTTPPP
jgi:hypothetical protein